MTRMLVLFGTTPPHGTGIESFVTRLRCETGEGGMAATATTRLQTIRDCQWSRPARLPPDATAPEPSGGVWVCVRQRGTVVRRPVTEQECSACPYWQAEQRDDE